MIPQHWKNVLRGTKLIRYKDGQVAGTCSLSHIGTTSASVLFPWAKKPTEVKLDVLYKNYKPV